MRGYQTHELISSSQRGATAKYFIMSRNFDSHAEYWDQIVSCAIYSGSSLATSMPLEDSPWESWSSRDRCDQCVVVGLAQ